MQGMPKFSFLGLVYLELGLNWAKRKVVASWTFGRNLKIVTLVTFLGVLNLAVLYYFSQNTAVIENHKRDSGEGYQNHLRLPQDQSELLAAVSEERRPRLCEPPHQKPSNSTLPIIYMITPTYQRWTQKADLTRLCNTLMQVPNLHWIVVEDAEKKSDLVYKLLSGCYSCKISRTTHLNVKTLSSKSPVTTMTRVEKLLHRQSRPHRGVLQRNIALRWLREAGIVGQLEGSASGVVYFGDDDNVYDLRMFDEMRDTKRVSVWPVGLSGGLKYEGPICEHGKVVDWYAMWDRERTFMIDMAGFAINLKLLLSKTEASFDMNAMKGRLEESILLPLVTQDELEPRADNCRTILVWHVKTAKPIMTHEEELTKKGQPSDPEVEV